MASSSFIRYTPEELLGICLRHASDSGFVPTIFLSHEADWHGLISKPVTGCWLAAREREIRYGLEGYLEDCNDWIVILELPQAENITIELKQVDARGNTITICRKGATMCMAERDHAEFGLLKGYACSFRNEVNTHTKAKDWLDRLEKSGVTRYQLQQGRGCRYWVDAVLRQFYRFHKGELPNLDQTDMVHVWESGHEVEALRGALPIEAGQFLPTKWPKSSHLYQPHSLLGCTEDPPAPIPSPALGPWRFQGTKFDLQSWFKNDGQDSQHMPSESSTLSESQPRPEHHMRDWRRQEAGGIPSWYTFHETD
ncbi:hypothetical protein F4814DRAFT_452405 [Daldinia grandis]|nr:hypothetical protein F4814DRAFT_452405 [Daldinia grandis]